LERSLGAWFDSNGVLSAEALHKDIKALLETPNKKTE
jgi:hypothetical protein